MTLPGTATFRPSARAVALVADAQAQSIAPVRPVASATLLINGERVIKGPPPFCNSCGMPPAGPLVLYVTVTTPEPCAIEMLVTYLVGTKPTAHAVAAAFMPMMSPDSKASATVVLAESARFRPS